MIDTNILLFKGTAAYIQMSCFEIKMTYGENNSTPLQVEKENVNTSVPSIYIFQLFYVDNICFKYINEFNFRENFNTLL